MTFFLSCRKHRRPPHHLVPDYWHPPRNGRAVALWPDALDGGGILAGSQGGAVLAHGSRREKPDRLERFAPERFGHHSGFLGSR